VITPQITTSGLIGLILLILMIVSMAVFAFRGRKKMASLFRPIPAFQKLGHAIGLSVEAGTRLHLTLGRGSLSGIEGASAVVGLNILERVARTASISDRPPIATSGDATIGILSQDVLYNSFRSIGASGTYDPIYGQVSGLTPFAYAAGTLPTIFDEQVSTTILTGHFGSEVALIADGSDRVGAMTLAGSDNLPAQAILYAAAQEPLIGEELYAAGAYLKTGPVHSASLRAQDLLRWVIILAIMLGSILKFLDIL